MSTASAPSVEELWLRAPDQTALSVRRVRPVGTPRARLAWVHGLAEHGGRYLPTLEWFAARGFECAVLDLRGHGRSGGRRVFVRRFSDYLDDVEAFLGWAGRELGAAELPLFLLGHSMGGLVVARTLQDRLPRLPTLAGAALLSPFFEEKVVLPVWKVKAAYALSRAFPWVGLPIELDVAQLSQDPAVGAAYLADPLVSKKATARWYTEITQARALALTEAHTLRLPTVVIHGTQDGLVAVEGSKAFHSALGSKDKQLRLWDGLRHELLNEVEKEAVREFLLEWIEARVPAS